MSGAVVCRGSVGTLDYDLHSGQTLSLFARSGPAIALVAGVPIGVTQ